MKKLFIIFVVLFNTNISYAKDKGLAKINALVAFIGNYDADTIRFNIPLWNNITLVDQPFRLLHIDTPEIRGKCVKEKTLAKKAKLYVENKLKNAHKIQVTFQDTADSFGRVLGEVTIDNKINLAIDLICKGYAVEYEKRKVNDWCQQQLPIPNWCSSSVIAR